MSLIGGKDSTRKAHRHQRSKSYKKHMNKGHKGKTNNILKSWVNFVKKIQKEEKIPSYKDAIQRAKVRKSEWKKGMMGGEGESEATEEKTPMDQEKTPMDQEKTYNIEEEKSDPKNINDDLPLETDNSSIKNIMAGGKKRRTRSRRRSRSSRRR
jgi:hypothetical protein